MDAVSQQGTSAKVIPFDLNAPFLLFPVRHHSPVCSYQLIKTIELYQPEAVLIEGPENANELVQVLADERTTLPAAIYYYYKDKKKYISDEGKDYKCYYPFLYSSPEYNALKAAAKMGIPAFFIDLPYSEILINTKENEGLLKGDEQSYADDSRLASGQFYKRLCEKTGIRSFEEFWEKYFEIEGLNKTPEEFVRAMHTYCTLTRSGENEEKLKADATLIREQHMAFNISEAMKVYKKVLVVTGGFHSLGLYELLQSGNIKPVKQHTVPKGCMGCFPAAYSYEAADALHGYASGMSYPYFYDSVFLKVTEQGSPVGVYDEVSLDMLTRCAKECKVKDLPAAISDVTAAHTLMHGLAALRNISGCGIFELFDGVTSCFIKGEKTISTAMPLEILKKLATGDGVGRIGDTAHTPPLVADFESKCEGFKLKYHSAVVQEKDISLFKSERELEMSRFFHRMEQLDTYFAERLKGADLHSGKDKSRVREVWRYRRSPQVDSALIDHTADGFTIEEACRNIFSSRLNRGSKCELAAQTAVDCFLCGIELKDEQQAISDIISSDGDMLSVGKGLILFDMLYNLSRLYEYDSTSPRGYLEMCFDRLIGALNDLADIPDEQAGDCIEILKRLYALVDTLFGEKRDILYAALFELTTAEDIHPAVLGAGVGLLYAFDKKNQRLAEDIMRGYLNGDVEIKAKGAAYLRGLFSASRDIVFGDNDFLRMTDKLIISMPQEEFMEILPNMRLAFSGFTPQEISRTAEAIAAVYGGSADSLLYREAVDEGLFMFGRELDSELSSAFERT